MYIILTGCAQQGASSPLAASVDFASMQEMAQGIGGATGSVVTFTTNPGEIDITVNASGGDGNYTFTWTLVKQVENSDNGNRFSIASTGTTNAARYNTATFNGARPASGLDAPFDAGFLARCQVQDGAGAAVNVDVVVLIEGITV